MTVTAKDKSRTPRPGRERGGTAVPEPPGRIELQAAAIRSGVDHEHPSGADYEVVDAPMAVKWAPA
jgi:hypothetical protein